MNLSLPCRGAAWHPQRRRTARCGHACLLLSRYPSAGPRPCRAWVCSLPWSASSCRRPCRTWRRRRCPWGARRRRGVRRRLPGETCPRWAYLPRPCRSRTCRCGAPNRRRRLPCRWRSGPSTSGRRPSWWSRCRCPWGARRRRGVRRRLPGETCPRWAYLSRPCRSRTCRRGATNQQRRRPCRWQSDPSPPDRGPRAWPNRCRTWCRRRSRRPWWCACRRCPWGARRRRGVRRRLPCGTCPTRVCRPRSCHRGAPSQRRRRPCRWRSGPSPSDRRLRARPNPCRTCACRPRPYWTCRRRRLPCGTYPTRACPARFSRPRSCRRGATNQWCRRPYRWRSGPSPWGQRPRARRNRAPA